MGQGSSQRAEISRDSQLSFVEEADTRRDARQNEKEIGNADGHITEFGQGRKKGRVDERNPQQPNDEIDWPHERKYYERRTCSG
jgi:hypothetical protein